MAVVNSVVPEDATAGTEPSEPEPASQSPGHQGVEEAAPEPVKEDVPDIFMMARQQNFTEALQALEAHPDKWTALDDEGHSLLHWGALVGSKDFVAAALRNGCPVDALAGNRQSPLMWAALRGHVQVVRQLLQAQASLAIKDSLGATPLMIAIQHRSYSAMLMILHRGKQALLGDGDKNGCTAAHWAAYKGDQVALKLLDYFGADLLALDNAKMTPLHRAVSASQASVVEFLIERKADPMVRNGEGKSCLDIVQDNQDVSLHALLTRLSRKRDDFDVEQGSDAKDGEGKGKGGGGGLFKSLMKDKIAQKAFPVFWLVCVSLAVFQYIMELRATSYQVAPTFSFLFELGIPASVALFFYVALMDPGKIPARTKGNSGVEELMRAIDSDTPLESPQYDLSRLCLTTWVLKDLRTKYCTQTNACIREFDHYCVWLNTAIGRGNHREFCCLAAVEWLTQLCHLYVCWAMATTLVPYQSLGSWCSGIVMNYPLLCLITLVQMMTVPWILMLNLHQQKLIFNNLTTNEMMNMHRYEHFWTMTVAGPGRIQKVFKNPFDKGGPWKNMLDFWWERRRSEEGNVPLDLSSCGSHSGCKSCQHHH